MRQTLVIVGMLLVLGMAHGSDLPLKPGQGGQDVVTEAYPPNVSYATGRLTWVSGNNYGKYSGPLEYGVGTSGTHRGWVKFDLSGVPDGIQVDEVVLAYHCNYRYSSRPSTAVRALGSDPVETGASTLWAVFSNAPVAAESVTHDTGWVYRTLNASGIAAVQSGLSSNWAAFGLEEVHNLLNYGGRADAYYSSLKPVLFIGFTADVDMGIAGCGPQTYPLVEGTVESLYVDVANVGASTVSGARVYLAVDSVPVDSVTMPAMAPSTQLRRLFAVATPRSGGERTEYHFFVRHPGDGNSLNDDGLYDDWVFRRGTWWAEGFDRSQGFPPPGWAIGNADGGLYSWGGGTPTTAHAGSSHGRCPNETSLRNDDWLVAPPQFITAGFQDTLGIFIRTGSSICPDTLEVWAMDGPTPADTVARIGTITAAQTEYIERRYGLQQFAGTTVRIGLRKLSASNNSMLVDNLSLARLPQVDAAVEAVLAPAGELRLPVIEHPAARLRNLGVAEAAMSLRFIVRKGYTVVYDTVEYGITLAAGDTLTRALAKPWTTADTGLFSITAFINLSGDGCRWNDTLRVMTHVAAAATGTWGELGSLPITPSGKLAKDGAWLAWLAGPGRMYAAKGNKTGDFYAWDELSGCWLERASWPLGVEMKGPGKGSCATGDGGNRIYATKGNNTQGFWSYDAATSAWTQLADVPMGSSNKRVKGGGDLAWGEDGGRGYVYLLKGQAQEFWRYDVAADSWTPLVDAPRGVMPKWDRGSWLAADGLGRIWAHKAKASELWTYDISSGTWSAGSTPGIPLVSPLTGKRKKAKDGSAGAWVDGTIYALKGGNTQEFWQFDVGRSLWSELDTMPAFGSTGKKKRVKSGGDLASDGARLFALKGGKTAEVWAWGPLGFGPEAGRQPGRSGVQGEGRTQNAECRVAAVQSPARAGRAALRFALPAAGQARLVVCDAAGRVALDRTVAGQSGTVDLGSLGRGVYLARLEGPGWTRTARLTVF